MSISLLQHALIIVGMMISNRIGYWYGYRNGRAA